MIPGTHPKQVNIMFNINAPILPVIKTATGGRTIEKKYFMINLIEFDLEKLHLKS